MNILVLDDSMTNLLVTEKYLKSFDDITNIVLSHEPKKVKETIDSNDIDILLLDVVMPEFDGYDVLNLLRSNRQYDDLPIIMFTSLLDTDSFKKCFELGASDYINKPIHPVEFNARIKAAIDTRSKSRRLNEMMIRISKQNSELKETNAKLIDAQFHLVQSEKMAAIGQLASGIAHEINNPMGFVNSNYETLSKYIKRISEYLSYVESTFNSFKESGDDRLISAESELREKRNALKIPFITSELDNILNDTLDGIQRVSKIVQSLRTFARTVKDDEKDTYELLDIINQVLLISHNEVKYVAQLSVDVPESIQVFCNKVQIGQVLINMIVNAAQAIKSQHRGSMGHINIIAAEEEDYARIEIIDDGPGISEDHLSKIFDPFFTTKEIGQGTGLGLSISYDIITNKHSGLIDVKSEIGNGTRFIIRLPLHNILTA